MKINDIKKIASKNKKTLMLVAIGVTSGGIASLFFSPLTSMMVAGIAGIAGIAGGKLGEHEEKQLPENDSEEDFSLLLITTSEKIKGKIDTDNVTNGECNQSIQLETVKNLINTSRYFLVDDADSGTLQAAKTSSARPDLEKDNLFILKITGQGKHNIATCKTKLALRDSITSESCKIEKVLHLLDARIAEKFVPTI